ncbi:Ionotropic receptor 900 [Blattella germanica]|nr:Ionotropic receptor 900 [Blattella germanica]
MEKTNFCVLLLYQWICFAFSEVPIPSSINIQDVQVIQCLQNITETYFPKNELLLLTTPFAWSHISPQRYDVVIDILFEDSIIDILKHWPLIFIGDLTHTDHYHLLMRYHYAVFILNCKDFNSQYLLMAALLRKIELMHWNPSAKFIIVAKGNHHRVSNQYVANNLLYLQWYLLRSLNVILLIPSNTKINNMSTSVIDVYTFYPNLQRGYCFQEVTKASLIDRWHSQEKRFIFENNLFPTNIPKHMPGCTVLAKYQINSPRVAYYSKDKLVSGTDVVILNIASHLYNFKISYSEINLTKHQNYQLEIRNVVNGLINIIIGGEANQLTYYYDLTYPYCLIQYIWSVPFGRHVPYWRSLLRIFSPIMWTAVLIVYIFYSVSFFLIHSFMSYGRNTTLQNLYDTIFYTLRMTIGVSIPRKPKKFALKVLFSFGLFYCMQIYTAYQSSLISVLTSRIRYPTLSTLEELENSDLQLCSVIKWLYDRRGQLNKRTYKKSIQYIAANDLDVYVDRIASSADIALLCDAYAIRQHISEGNPKFTRLKENAGYFFGTMHLTKGSPLVMYIDNVVGILQSAGIINLWMKTINFYSTSSKEAKEAIASDGPTVLKIQHLQGSFFLLFVGLCIAIVSFIFEKLKLKP